MYCQNCGSEIDQNSNVCPYCGQMNSNSEAIKRKDIKIQELEQKIEKLEKIVEQKSSIALKKTRINQFQPWIFITPIVFVIVFFVFFILLISIR